MPSDFSSQGQDDNRGKKKSLSFLFPVLLVIIGTVFIFYRFIPLISHPLNRGEGTTVDESSVGKEEILPQPPREEYGFYNALLEEEPQLFDRRQQGTAPDKKQSYSLLVEYFNSYDRAFVRSKELQELKVQPVRVEPFAREGDLKFRIRVGPYTSRSKMNAMRDVLYHNDIPHRLHIKQE